MEEANKGTRAVDHPFPWNNLLFSRLLSFTTRILNICSSSYSVKYFKCRQLSRSENTEKCGKVITHYKTDIDTRNCKKRREYFNIITIIGYLLTLTLLTENEKKLS